MSNFDPKQHLITMKGGKEYLPVQWRIRWFRNENPNGVIATEVLSMTPPLVKCTITNNENVMIATGHGSATSKGTEVWAGRDIEKAESAAIGRALRNAGYGTEFGEDDEDIVDAPIQRSKNASKPRSDSQNSNGNDQTGTSKPVRRFDSLEDVNQMFTRFADETKESHDYDALVEYAEMVGQDKNLQAWNDKYASRKEAWERMWVNYRAVQEMRPKSTTDIPF